jgi:glycosyltransferase involved in cell wall biosynthesis
MFRGAGQAVLAAGLDAADPALQCPARVVTAPPMAEALRVCAITTSESAAATAGAGIALARWRAALIARGHRIELITCPESPSPGPPEGAAARLRAACAAFSGELVRRWTAERPDLVHVELAGNVGLAALTAANRLGLPTTTSFHHLHLYAAPGAEAKVIGLLAAFHRRCTATVAEQDASARLLTAMGAAEVAVIHRGVDSEEFHPRWRDAALRAVWGAGPDDPVLLFVARVIPTKDPPGFAAACQLARERNQAVRAVVVGEGAELAALRQALPWAHYAGTLLGEAMRRTYASADIFVQSSPAEPWGMAAMEAASSGLAVAARPGGAVNEVLAPAGGCVLPLPRDRAALAEAVAALACDPLRRRQLGDRGRAGALALSWDSIAARWEELWRDLLARRR